MPPSFLGMVHGITVAKSYSEAVRQEILAAGDNCSRVAFIGAYTAAKYSFLSLFHIWFQCGCCRYGLDSIPVEWLTKVNRIEQLMDWVEKIVSF